MHKPVAAIWTPKRLVAAADIIHEVNNIYFACSGLTAAAGFDAIALITATLEEGSGFTGAINAAAEALEEPLAAAAQHMNNTAPEEFKNHLASREALTVIFFGIHESVVSLVRLAFRTKKRGKQVVLVREHAGFPNGSTDIMSIEFVTAGANRDADDAFKKSTNSQQALVHPEQSLQNFMKQAGAAFPVQGLRLTKTEAARITI